MTLNRIIWLASYPKSGNTWLRILLGNYFMPKGQEIHINNIFTFTTADNRQDFFDRAAGRPFTATTLEEWLAMRPAALRLIAASKPGTHFVKTHCKIARVGGQVLIPPELTAGAIYVYRNPFDVVLSFSRHMGLDVDATIAMMADENAMNASPRGLISVLGRWDTNIASWTGAEGLWRHVMRYEDMVADTEGAMKRVLAFLKVPPDIGKLRRAIRLSSFETLQKQEETAGFRERPEQMKKFFHSGATGGWRDKLTRDQIRKIRHEFAAALELHYPELIAEADALARSE